MEIEKLVKISKISKIINWCKKWASRFSWQKSRKELKINKQFDIIKFMKDFYKNKIFS